MATHGEMALDVQAEDSMSREKLKQALEAGTSINVRLGGHWSERFLFRPSKLVDEGFELSVGADEGSVLAAEIASFEGVSDGKSKANLVMVGDTIAVTIREQSGAVIKIRTNSENGSLEARREDPDDQPFSCVLGESSIASTRSLVPLSTMEELWSNAMPADLMAVTGVDPATGETDKYIDPIRRAPLYDQSLADLRLLLVLDKSATGSADEANLVSKASLYMATVANVAACYENQLGIRLLLHELIMIPDSDTYEDVPVTITGEGSVRSFEAWLKTHRTQETYLWSSAIKFGAGLDDRYLGLATLQSIESTTAVGICDPSALWNLLAHEIGHNLGSNHSDGGVMNSYSLGGDVRTFFANVEPGRIAKVEPGRTAAMEVHTHSSSELLGQGAMRHPEEMPFANDDRIVTALNESVQFNSLENDSRFVLNGEENLLELAEVGAVTPSGAGTAVKIGNEILFTPAEDFVGTAWFSYSVRGNVGNSGAGWLHKGDVAVVVDEEADAFEITMAPGDSYSLEVRSGIKLTQPNQARVVKARDFNRLLLITANADAVGMDTFEAGGDTYTIHYDAGSKVTLPDFVVHDPGQKSVTFNPLLNDPGAGQRWIHSVRPTLGVAAAGEKEDGHDQVLFPKAFQLVSVENLSPELGALTQPEINVSLNGIPATVRDEIVTFTPVVGAAGVATLRYTVEDAAGHRASETAEILLPFQVDPLVEASSSARLKVPAGNDGAVTEWMQLEFDDSGWRMGNASMGYAMGEGSGSENFATDLSEMAGMTSSVWARIPFEVDEVSDYSALSLRMRIDDGFVAYLNGEEIARMHAAGASPLTWNASATTDNPSTQGAARMVFDVTKHLGLLSSGGNVLAIHGLNASPISSDFLLIPELDAAVHGQTVGITSPQHSSVGVPEGVTLFLQGNAGGRPVQWMVLSSPEGGVATIHKPSAEETAIDFSAPGEYQIALLSPGAFQTRNLTIQVGDGREGIPVGVAISTVESILASSVQVDIEAFVEPLMEGDLLQWELAEGPGEVAFLDENAKITQSLFSLAGDYVLRALVTRNGVTTVDVVRVTVPPDAASAALPGEVTVQEAGRVRIDGRIEGIIEREVALTLVLGLVDGGRDQARWEESRSFGGFGLGGFSLEVENLRSDSVYFYRLMAVDGDKKSWSYLQSFRTSVIDTGEEVVSLLEENKLSLPLYDYPSPGWDKAGWNQLDFTAGDWFKSDGFPIGYGEAYDDLESNSPSALSTMQGRYSSVFLRVPFLVTGAERYSRLALKMQFDDGFVAYLNGVEIARANVVAGEALQDDALAINDVPTSQGMAEGMFEVESFESLLREGENVLALQGVNASIDSADFRMMADLLARVPEVKSRIVSPTDDEIGIPQHVGLIVAGSVPDGNTLEGEGWSVVSVPEGGDAVIAEPEMLETSVRFTKKGRYVLRFAAADEEGEVASDFVTVHVAGIDLYLDAHHLVRSYMHFDNGFRIYLDKAEVEAEKIWVSLDRAGASGYLDSISPSLFYRAIPGPGPFQARLYVPPRPFVESRLEKISGPGSVRFASTEGRWTFAQFSSVGHYELRRTVRTAGIRTFDDATVTISRPLPGNGEDLDGDQIPDFEEWALGSNPIDEGIGLDYLPRLTRSGEESIFSYPVRSDAAEHGLSYIVEASSDLKEWIVPEPGAVSFTGGRVENRFPDRSSKMLFYRLRFNMSE